MISANEASEYVAIPMKCGFCQKPIEARIKRAAGFGYSGFYQVPCPHCEQFNHRHLPGTLLDVVAGR